MSNFDGTRSMLILEEEEATTLTEEDFVVTTQPEKTASIALILGKK